MSDDNWTGDDRNPDEECDVCTGGVTGNGGALTVVTEGTTVLVVLEGQPTSGRMPLRPVIARMMGHALIRAADLVEKRCRGRH